MTEHLTKEKFLEKVFNYEIKDTYYIRLRSTDSGGLEVESELVVNILDEDDLPSISILEVSEKGVRPAIFKISFSLSPFLPPFCVVDQTA